VRTKDSGTCHVLVNLCFTTLQVDGMARIPGLTTVYFVCGLESTQLACETHTGGGAVLGKPGGSPARRHSRNTVLKKTSAYADIQTNKE